MPDGRATRGHLDNLVPLRMNSEPPILRGCSSSELVILAVAALACWLPIMVPLGIAFDLFAAFLGLAGLLVVGTIYLGAVAFQAIKRARPSGYYFHRPMIWLHRRGLRRSRLHLPDGQLSLGRTRYP